MTSEISAPAPPTPSRIHQLLKENRALCWLGGVSLLCAALWQWNYPVWVTSDSLEYIAWAEGIFNHGRQFAVHRSPGYPMLLGLLAVPWEQTFWIVRIAQALMGAAIPCLVYLTLRPLSRPCATVVGWLTLASTIPFTYTTHIMTEQLSMFLFYLLVFLSARVLNSTERPAWWLFGCLGLCGWLLLFTRPASGLVIYLLLVLGGWLRRTWWRRWLAVAGLIWTLNGVWFVVDANYWTFGGLTSTFINHHENTTEAFAKTYSQILADHIRAGQYDRPLLDAHDGPATQKMLDDLAVILRTKPEIWTSLSPASLYGDYAGQPEVLLRHIETDPAYSYAIFVPTTLRAQIGREELKQLLPAFAAEHHAGPFWRFLKSLPFGVSTKMDGKMLFWQIYNPSRYYGNGDAYHRGTLIHPENGPATRFFLEQMVKFLRTYPENWEPLGPPGWFDRFKGRPEDLVQAMLDQPDLTYHWFIWTVMDNQFGPYASNELLKQVAKEAVTSPLREPLLFWDNFVNALIGPGEVIFNGGIRTVDISWVRITNTAPYAQLPASLDAEITAPAPLHDFNTYFYRTVYLSRPFVVFGIFIFALFALRGPARNWFVFGMVLWLMQTMIPAVFASPHLRYTDYLIPLQWMLLGVGWCAWRSQLPAGRLGRRA